MMATPESDSQQPGDGDPGTGGTGQVPPAGAGPPSVPPPPGQPPRYPPTPPRRRFPIWLIVLIVVAALCCLGGGIIAVVSLAGGGGPVGTGGPSPTASGKVGTPVRDGNFEFLVSGVQCGRSRIGTDPVEATANGQFCLVSLTVTNIGKQPQTFSDTAQRAFAADGSEYAPDSEADVVANDDGQVFFNEINPGNQVAGTLVFDIPKSASIARLELHDSAFSVGVSVTVP